MRITLSGAMRARDVSRPTDEQVAAAAEREAKGPRVGRPGGAGSATAGRTPTGSPAPGNSTPGNSARTAADKPNGPTPATHGWDNGRADRGDAVAPAPAADDVPSPTRRRRRRRAR